MEGGEGQNDHICTVNEVFDDYKGRRSGIISALTTDYEDFYRMCNPEKENFYLIGYPDGKWQVSLPFEEVPSEIPEPTLGINFARDGMVASDWITLVAAHSEAWLFSVAFYFAARFGFDKAQRKTLFNMINDLPTVYEIVTLASKKQLKGKKPVLNHIHSKPKQSFKSQSTEEREGRTMDVKLLHNNEREEEDEEHDNALCGACGQYDGLDEFWICCDKCERWFHGRCVKITPAKAEQLKLYKCSSCSNKKRPHPS
ncbi:unnamed protein product [Cuscuta epithymum]|uniref:PHD finger protein ALFIN-LIKE n=1 Tax=Cuscuta epithymum TaxID=186058 RepID=A0AAV0D7B3_9ASTE|nr:unnamed protein product [Cuscuta epithymum]